MEDCLGFYCVQRILLRSDFLNRQGEDHYVVVKTRRPEWTLETQVAFEDLKEDKAARDFVNLVQ